MTKTKTYTFSPAADKALLFALANGKCAVNVVGEKVADVRWVTALRLRCDAHEGKRRPTMAPNPRIQVLTEKGLFAASVIAQGGFAESD